MSVRRLSGMTMRSVLKDGFEADDRFTIESIHETVHRQYLGFRKAKREVPDFARDAHERRKHNRKWEYINGEFAAWLADLDQKTIVGHKLNEKLTEIQERGEADNWQLW